MASQDKRLKTLRTVITENLRVQRGGSGTIPYIDVTNALTDVTARQNHAIFGRRGCGKTLLLHHSTATLGQSHIIAYLNCEDFKKHSFPNVIVEILDALCVALSDRLGGFLGRKRKIRKKLNSLRKQLAGFRVKPDKTDATVREATESEETAESVVEAQIGLPLISLRTAAGGGERKRLSLERSYQIQETKVRDLDMWLPKLKNALRDVVELAANVDTVFLELDDYYHLRRVDQPYVMDFVHRLCKDLPFYFKVATLRHASVLYADRGGQPIGAQERHDYQPINIDFTLAELQRTRDQNREILHEFGRMARLDATAIDGLFKGEGFQRLVLAGGGVPRDCLSLFLEVLDDVTGRGDGRIGKDDVRILK